MLDSVTVASKEAVRRTKFVVRSRPLWCLLLIVTSFVVAQLSLTQAHALPWDMDLFKQQSYKSNEMARAPVEGTVPMGFRRNRMTTEEAAASLKNPIPRSIESVLLGKRLWNSNCSACHGLGAAADGKVGPFMGVPSLLTDFYRQREDGRIYGVIQNGGANMPRYGFKFSEEEHWHLVNYLRELQDTALLDSAQGVAKIEEPRDSKTE